MSAAEAEAEISEMHGMISVQERIDIAVQLAEQAVQMYASAWARCLEIKTQIPHNPQLN